MIAGGVFDELCVWLVKYGDVWATWFCLETVINY